MNRKFFRTYLLPGFIFQSLTIGGGYGTGRELVEFFLTEGPLGGLLGMLVATIIWSLVLAISFELSRLTQTYDYKSFIRSLLGPGWIAYEIVYFIGLILVVSVLGSASGELLRSMLGLADMYGVVLMMILIGGLVFFGSGLIEKALSIWSFALYGAYLFLIIICLTQFGDTILTNIGLYEEGSKWMLGGIRYSAYNIGVLPAMLFVVRHIETRKEAFLSGAIAGVMTMIPGVFIFVSMLSQYPEILPAAVPVNFLLDKLHLPGFQLVFQIILFGTFVETGVGLTHGLNERIAREFEDRNKQMPPWLRVLVATAILLLGIFIADALGLVAIIAKGYGTLTWGYMIVFVIPVVTLGIWRIRKSPTN